MSELPLSDQAIVRLADRVAARHPDDVALLERLVRIPSVSGPDPDSQALARSAQAVADELDAAKGSAPRQSPLASAEACRSTTRSGHNSRTPRCC